MKVCIKFCGGCNPRIDRVSVAEQIKAQLVTWGIDVVYNNLDADFIIYISGCQVSCASHQRVKEQACLIIAGCSVNIKAVAEENLSELAIEKVRDYLGKVERPLQK